MAQIEVLKIAPRKGNMLFHPFAHVLLTGYSKDSENRILLSPQLMTPDEVDYCIDHLVGQLENVRKAAKRHIATARGSAGWCKAKES
jgi:hypothetical protein